MTLTPGLDDLPEDLTPVMEGGTPFARTLGARVVSRSAESVVLSVDAPVSLHNHVGGPHAATLFGLAETAAAAMILERFEDLFRGGAVPLIKSAEISYRAIAQGEVTATARFTGDETGVRGSLASRGVAVFPIEVSLAVADGTEVAVFIGQMALKRF